MDKMGQSKRILCDAKCILNFKGLDYHGVVENVSLTGALIKLDNKIPSSMQPGDRCDLILCSNLDSCTTKYSCKVIRLDSAIIGVQFLELKAI